MYFASPMFFILVILIAFVVLLYFFRKQYKAVINPSNLLWQQAMNEWKASPWIQKLQHNLLFWLQVIALTLLMIALAKPIWLSEGVKGEQLIWIVDTSATMSALKDDKQLIEESKQQMKQMTERLNDQEVTLIVAGRKPQILLNRESNINVIQKTIDGIAVTYEHENIEKSVKLAESLVSNRETHIHIFSDSVKKEDLIDRLENVSYEIHNAHGIQDNIALLSFGVAGKENRISGLVVIENQGEKSKTVPLVITSENQTIFQQKVTIPAGKQSVVNVPDLPQRRFYQALIKSGDKYSADDELTAVYSVLKPNVYALGEINPFFIKGLETLGIKTVQMDQNSILGLKESGIILAEGIPVDVLPKMPAIYINKKQDSANPIELKEPIKETDSSLTEYVDIDKTYIKYASSPITGNWGNIVYSGNHPLIQTGTMNGQPVIILNFSLENTDWPLHPGFPIFLYNSYQWLSNQTGFLGYFQPGEEKWLQLKDQNTSIELFNAFGKSISTLQLNKENFKAPNKPGIYQAVSEGQVYYFSVLLDDREKRPQSEASFILNGSKENKKELTLKPNDSLWFWLTCVVLLLLMVEWEVYRRGFRA
ncbi:BatA and WFA domain-containing protein [Neobacillus sp. WH10]|uniref:vWA domain-containing protein n=1 Tax=Neobacillus sp. WH10 TaxID=3047873 RepID=UPI0024C1BE18|nr:BatA and WFA domain-containing protein [Neobacillus sp. WH10]WHY79316.1 BatA and WFA domain-containing protein [Neobacillus sp. WH10]